MNRYLISFICAPIIVVAIVLIMFQLIQFKPEEVETVTLPKKQLEIQVEDFPMPQEEVVQIIAPKLTLPAKPTQMKPPSFDYDSELESDVHSELSDEQTKQPKELPLIEIEFADSASEGYETREKISSSSSSGTALNPMYTVKPRYPNKARRKGIEGFVILVFDVSVIGTVENIRVEKARPHKVFEQYAIKAVKTWKYEPLIVDGVKHSFKNKRVVLDFKIVE
jgi:periplasmic protein TonB